MESSPKRKIKDSVFTDLFQNKKYLLQLYKALHPEDSEVTENELADTYNIIIRALMYLVQTYHDYFKRTNQNLYGSKKVTMPKPELYVIFTGDRKSIPDKISLSKEFFAGEKISIDAEVKVLYQENENDIIGQYIIFTKVYNEQRKNYGATKEAILETIRICKDRNIQKEYLESREKEVVDMMMTLFDDEQILKAYTKDVEDNATQKMAKNTAIKMIRKGKMSLEEIAEYVPSLSMEELKKLEAEVLQLA